jgi:hypothetical protein
MGVIPFPKNNDTDPNPGTQTQSDFLNYELRIGVKVWGVYTGIQPNKPYWNFKISELEFCQR